MFRCESLRDVGALEHDRAGRGVEEFLTRRAVVDFPQPTRPPDRASLRDKCRRDVVDGLDPADFALENDPARDREVLLQVAHGDQGALGGRELGANGRGRQDAHRPLLAARVWRGCGEVREVPPPGARGGARFPPRERAEASDATALPPCITTIPGSARGVASSSMRWHTWEYPPHE